MFAHYFTITTPGVLCLLLGVGVEPIFSSRVNINNILAFNFIPLMVEEVKVEEDKTKHICVLVSSEQSVSAVRGVMYVVMPASLLLYSGHCLGLPDSSDQSSCNTILCTSGSLDVSETARLSQAPGQTPARPPPQPGDQGLLHGGGEVGVRDGGPADWPVPRLC